MGPAGGDQLSCALGIFCHGIIPGLTSTPKLADDVVTDNLDFCMKNENINIQDLDAFFLNAKGFGGNNATASIYNPNFVKSLLPKIFTKSEITTYKKSLEINENNRLNYHKKCLLGDFDLLYRANEELLDPEKDIEISENYIKLKDYPKIEM